MQLIQLSHEEGTIYHQYFTDKNFNSVTAKVHAKNNTCWQLSEMIGHVSIKRKMSDTNRHVLPTLKSQGKTETATPAWCQPTTGDSLPPAEAKQRLVSTGKSKTGFVWREMPQCS